MMDNDNIIEDFVVPELASYQSEPKQLPSGTVGKKGFLSLEFRKRSDKTVLMREAHRVPLQAQKAIYLDERLPTMPYVFIMAPTGGILQGDRLAINIEVGEGAQAHVTTQSATKIYEMDANYGLQTQKIVLKDGAYLEYMPDLVIPNRHSRFVTLTDIEVADTSTLLYSEILMPGRKHKDDEIFLYDLFSSTVNIYRPEGTTLFTERFIVEPYKESVRNLALMGSFDVLGNVLFVSEPRYLKQVFDNIPCTICMEQGWAAGMSYLPYSAGLIYKVVGNESEIVAKKIREFWAEVRKAIWQVGLPNLRKA